MEKPWERKRVSPSIARTTAWPAAASWLETTLRLKSAWRPTKPSRRHPPPSRICSDSGCFIDGKHRSAGAEHDFLRQHPLLSAGRIHQHAGPGSGRALRQASRAYTGGRGVSGRRADRWARARRPLLALGAGHRDLLLISVAAAYVAG